MLILTRFARLLRVASLLDALLEKENFREKSGFVLLTQQYGVREDGQPQRSWRNRYGHVPPCYVEHFAVLSHRLLFALKWKAARSSFDRTVAERSLGHLLSRSVRRLKSKHV